MAEKDLPVDTDPEENNEPGAEENDHENGEREALGEEEQTASDKNTGESEKDSGPKIENDGEEKDAESDDSSTPETLQNSDTDGAFETDLESETGELPDEFSDDDPPSRENQETAAGKRSKVLILSGSTLIILLIGGYLLYGSLFSEEQSSENIYNPSPGYIASIKIPEKKRKRLKSGLELSLEADSKKQGAASPFKKLIKNEENSLNSTESNNNSSISISGKGSVPTARVIGARMVPGKGLAMPSVTSAAYQAIPPKKKSPPVTAPDEDLMENIDGKVVPKISSNGKGAYQVYNHSFSPSIEKIKVPQSEEIQEIPFARVSVIIRGLGLNRNATLAAINKLPGAISLAFSPYANSIEEWASLARSAGHETLISLPMEPMNFPSSDPGPLSLWTSLTVEENIQRLNTILALSQAYVGVVQTMGSKYVKSEATFKPVVKSLKERGLLFVDDGLVQNSLAIRLSAELALPHARCDMIIDDNASGVRIRQNLLNLEKIAKTKQSNLGLAKRNLTALGIGEPYPATIMEISRWAKTLQLKKIDLAPVTAVVRDKFPKPDSLSTEKPKS